MEKKDRDAHTGVYVTEDGVQRELRNYELELYNVHVPEKEPNYMVPLAISIAGLVLQLSAILVRLLLL